MHRDSVLLSIVLCACGSGSGVGETREEETTGAEVSAPSAPVEPAAPAATGPIPFTCHGVDCGSVLAQMFGATEAPVSSPTPPPLPSASEPHTGARPASLAEAVGYYDAMAVVDIDDTQDRTLERALSRLRTMVDRFAGQTARLDAACAELFRADPALLPACTTLRADARDALARLVQGYRMRPPVDYEARVAERPANEREGHLTDFTNRMRAMTDVQVSRIYCNAAALYEYAHTPRAEQQLERYGEVFLAHCEATRATTSE